MSFPYVRTSGTVAYLRPDGSECGREWFSLHRHDQGRFIRAMCEMDDHGLVRDATWSLDSNWLPIDGYVRVVLGGEIVGSTSYAFDDRTVSCHARTSTHGTLAQVRTSDRPYQFLGLHPLIGDGLIAAVRGKASAGEEQMINSITCSYSENGETELLALPIVIGVTYDGNERLAIAAGEFNADRFLVRWRPEWPPATYWVWGDDYIFLKSTWEISRLTCELTSMEITPEGG